jgi:hypothetical protein
MHGPQQQQRQSQQAGIGLEAVRFISSESYTAVSSLLSVRCFQGKSSQRDCQPGALGL